MVELRQLLELPLDDLRVVTREFIHPEVSRSGLARCLSRYGLEDLRTLKAQRTAAQAAPAKSFKAYAPGYVHVDVKYLPTLNDAPREYLFVASASPTKRLCLTAFPTPHDRLLRDGYGLRRPSRPRSLVQRQPGRFTAFADDSTDGRDALPSASGRRSRATLRRTARPSSFWGA